MRRNTRIVGLEGDDVLSAVRIDGPGGEERLVTTALFSFIGADPASQWLSGSAALDDRGFVLTDRSLGREHLNGAWKTLGRFPLPFETSRPGLFASETSVPDRPNESRPRSGKVRLPFARSTST